SPSSVSRVRLYEKGKQPEYKHLERSDWVRIEAQIRPAKEAKEGFNSITPLQCWGASKWTRELAARVLQEHVEPHSAGSTYRLTEREAALRWMCKQYGAHLLSLAADLGGWDCVGLTLSEIIKDQAKGR
ncbi:MAG: replication initiation factor, partial [Acinetobacter sp.]